MHLKIFLVFVLYLNYNVKSQYCTESKIVTKTVRETFQYPITESYIDKCWFGRQCKKTRSRFIQSYNTVPKRVIENVKVCCSGYRTDDVYTHDGSIACSPICWPPCRNGSCASPGECACDAGYVADPSVRNNCKPTCGDCVHGACTAPNVCSCDFGYSLQNGKCQAICTEPCKNGTCVAPDTCQCLPGYRKSESNVCTPYCSQGCWHGTCTAPDTCVCDKGWRKNLTEECVPHCEKECGNGTCTAPNACECAPGYQIDTNNVPMCVPQCHVDCGNGTCTAPNICTCKLGYQLDESKSPLCVPRCDIECGNGTCTAPNACECAPGYRIERNSVPMCVPHCDVDCGNGTCIAPNICLCEVGYHVDVNKVPLCTPYCALCEGTCVAPGNCECEEPSKAKLVTADDQNCDDTLDIKCDRTVCTVETTTRTTDENITYGYDDIAPNDTIQIGKTKRVYEIGKISNGFEDYDYNTNITFDDNSTIDVNIIGESEEWIQSKWAYAAISIVVGIVAIVLVLVAVFWRSLAKCCGGGSYVIGENNGPSQESSEMRLSSILKKREVDPS